MATPEQVLAQHGVKLSEHESKHTQYENKLEFLSQHNKSL